MKTKIVKLADIKPAPYNPREELTARDYEYKALAASIDENGLVLPLIVNKRDGYLVGGHQRLNVLLANGETETNAVIVDLDEAQAKALCIALNKIEGEDDAGKLADLLAELTAEKVSLLSTGLTESDVADLLGDIRDAEIDDEGPAKVAKKEDTAEGVRCLVGDYVFRMDAAEFEDLIADVREKVGFTQELECAELKRRLFHEV